MDNGLLGQKYKILDTLYSDDIQSIYLANDTTRFSLQQIIINEIKDIDFAFSLKEILKNQDLSKLSNFVEIFSADSILYIVGNLAGGTTLESFLSDNNLRLSDKMYLAESLLTELTRIRSISPVLKYLLCSLGCISVTNRKNLDFNLYFFMPDKQFLNMTEKDIIKKVGETLCCIFANSPTATLENNKDSLPPAMIPIIKKCLHSQYDSIPSVHKDFKSCLLYSTFIGNTSIDTQIRKNLHKAKRKRSIGLVKKASALTVATALVSCFLLAKGLGYFDKQAPASNNDKPPVTAQSSKPTAKFSLSKNKIYAGDEITFTSEVSDPDLNDSIKEYEWIMSKGNGFQTLFSTTATATHKFDEPGNYDIALVVSDSKGNSSDAFKCTISVLPKQIIPTPTTVTSNSSNSNDAK